MTLQSLAPVLLLTAAAQALSATVVFLAPLPLFLLRRRWGARALLLSAIIGSVSFYFFAPTAILSLFLLSCVLVEVFSQCESHNLGYGSASFVTFVILSGVVVLFFSFAHQRLGFNPVTFFEEQIELAQSRFNIKTETKDEVLKQIPSALAMLLMFTIWINSVLITKLEKALKQTPVMLKHKFSKNEIKQWKLPEVFIWPTLLIVAGKFLLTQPLWLKWTSVNLFNAVLVLYFFHGLALVATYFDKKKISSVWRILIYTLIFSQLFLAVIFLGFIDLWMDFRGKMKTDKSTRQELL
ncbi:MAG: DUF2232 domain-containing protein [Oligoflexia bacterium]|nr:DUF2232 domain-containing protein [Oligoflexia bacterium]